MFLLREVFEYPYEDVARIVDKSPANCRQILVRARAHIEEGRRRYDVSREDRQEITRRFLAAWEDGNTAALIELLAPDATLYGDGGGKAPAVPRPLVGGKRIAKALVGWVPVVDSLGIVRRLAFVSGEPGIAFYYPDGKAAGVSAFEIADGVVVAIRSISNPDKLARVAPMS